MIIKHRTVQFGIVADDILKTVFRSLLNTDDGLMGEMEKEPLQCYQYLQKPTLLLQIKVPVRNKNVWVAVLLSAKTDRH